ncbi:MAG TPA: ABC transporter substrate-binding protein [Candidatus Eisenbacteria bacterium]|jgi:polar amino acid transport system substrate-binding protein|nr:ABC transporter substrate-binding protein [Candidatus Eisenbacteria bacterium]
MIYSNRWRLSALAVLAVALTACGGGTSTGPSPSPTPSASPQGIKTPTNLVKAGTLTFLSDTTYPPQESIDTATNKAVGFDVDVANAIAGKMGLTATIQTADFSTIIDGLLAKKADAIISAMSITPERSKKVAFVGYFSAGQSILVRKGNPLGISALKDLCGRKVAVQVTTTEQDTLNAENAGDCKSNKITIQTFPADTDAVQKLKIGAVDAAMDDSPVAAYYVSQDPNSFELGGTPVQSAPEGIAIDPNNKEVLQAVQQAMLAIFADGTYHKLLVKWNMLDGEIQASQIVQSPSP